MAKIPQRKEEHFKLKVIGKSGLFHMDNEIDVEYLQTSVSVEQIEEIVPVRRIFKRGELPFDMMMQRELDDERVVNDLVPYLLDNELSFFPPITVVILDIDRTTSSSIKALYPKLKLNNNYTDGSGNIYQKREYGNLFSVEILKDEDNLERWYTELTVGSNATLLAIDGQHRLVALQAVLNKLPRDEENIYKNLDNKLQEKIKERDFSTLSIPITFIFVPELYDGNKHNISLVEGFRKIFVDINRNARKVNEMRNVLLDEQDLRSIFTRKLCAKIQENNTAFQMITIDEIEWEKTTKENQLTNPLAITNILFLREMFSDWVGREDKEGKTRIKVAMNLNQYSAELDANKNYLYDDLDVQNFSFQQKELIIDIFNSNYLECFLFVVNSIPLALKRSEIISEIRKDIEAKIENATTPSEIELNDKIKNVLFDGEEKNIHLKDKKVKIFVDSAIKPLMVFQKKYEFDIVRTKLFQVAYFQTLFNLFNDKLLKNIETFNDFSRLVYDLNKNESFIVLWGKFFVHFKNVIDKGLKGNRGYSSSNPLIECLSNIIYLFLIQNFKGNDIPLNEENFTLKIDKLKLKIKNSFLLKYGNDLQSIFDDQDEIDKKTKEYSREIDKFLELLSKNLAQ